MTKQPPIIFRLLLCTLFMPIMLLLCILWCGILFYAPEPLWEDQNVILGVRFIWVPLTLLTLPFVLWLWMFWSGNWRRPVLTAGIIYAAFFFIVSFELIEMHTPPEKRMIHLDGTRGTDVYCNGVHLGQLPMTIRVDELIAKVPQWDSPPQQRWYDDTAPDQILYTWLPWDDFIKERFIASTELSEAHSIRGISNVQRAIRVWREALNKHSAGARYWWSYKIGDSQLAFVRGERSSYLHRSFDKQSSYYAGIAGSPFSPSVGFHAQLLVDVLPELTPEQKADWDQHVLKHWSLVGGPLKSALYRANRNRDKNDPLFQLYETALHSTARLQYHLSDPPTEEEARRLLADWVADDRNPFDFNYDFPRGEFSATSWADVATDTLLPANIHEVMRKPLIEQWRKNKYRFETGWAPVVYYSCLDKSPDYFAGFARFVATTRHSRLQLLENESPLTVPLFKTLLHRRSLHNLMTAQTHLYGDQIETYSSINNPLVETEMRAYITHALSDPNHTDGSRRSVNMAVFKAVMNRTYLEDVDKDELAAWVASLSIPASSKSFALRTLRIRRDEGLTLADRLQQAAQRFVMVETELTLDDLTNWFAENPEGDLNQFISEQEENITISMMAENVNYRGFTVSELSNPEFIASYQQQQAGQLTIVAGGELPRMFVIALLRSDTPEGDPQVRELIRQIWTRGPLGQMHVLEAIAAENTAVGLRHRDFSHITGSNNLPDYILDWFKEELNHEASMYLPLPSILALCDSPKAEEILVQWLENANESNRLPIARCLEIWRTRHTLRQMKMEFFQDLLAGRMSPDDLLLPQPAWVWGEEGYVQER